MIYKLLIIFLAIPMISGSIMDNMLDDVGEVISNVNINSVEEGYEIWEPIKEDPLDEPIILDNKEATKRDLIKENETDYIME